MIKFKKLIAGLTLGVLSVGMGVGVIGTQNVDVQKADAASAILFSANLAKHAGRESIGTYVSSTIVRTTQGDGYIFDTNVVGGSNNNNQWTEDMHFGGKNGTNLDKRAAVDTVNPIGDAITDIEVTFTDKGYALTGIEVVSSTSKDFSVSPQKVAYTIKDTDKNSIKIALPNSVVNSFYKLDFLYKNVSKNGTIKVQKIDYWADITTRTLSSISAKLVDSAKEYYAGEKITKDDIDVTATYSNGAIYDVTSKITFADTTLKSGVNTLNLNYNDAGVTKTCVLEVNALGARKVVDLQIAGNWTSKHFVEGTNFLTKGFSADLVYDDKSTTPLKGKEKFFTYKFCKTGTKTELTAVTSTELKVDLYITFANDPEYPGVTITNTIPLVLEGYVVDPVEMNLSWYDAITAFKVGTKFALDGDLVIRYNNGTPSRTLDLAKDIVEFKLGEEIINIKEYLFTEKDNGKLLTISYSHDGLTATTARTLTIFNDDVISRTIKKISTQQNWADKTDLYTFTDDKVTFKATKFEDGKFDNHPRFYASNNTWRIYEHYDLTLSIPEDYIIVSINLKMNKGGFLNYSETKVYNSSTVELGKTTGTTEITGYTITYRLTNVKLLSDWSDKYMHMTDADYNGDGTGLCISKGTYVTAKKELVKLIRQYEGIQNEFETNATLKSAYDRYMAWSRACHDTTPFAGEGIVETNFSLMMNNDNTIIVTIVLISILSVSAIALLAIAKRKKATR